MEFSDATKPFSHIGGVALAYAQLWFAQPLTTLMPRPFQRYLDKYKTSFASPTDVLRDFPRIISTIETLKEKPKPCGERNSEFRIRKLPFKLRCSPVSPLGRRLLFAVSLWASVGVCRASPTPGTSLGLRSG